MRNIILSIRPQYVKEILNGNKKYEFRRTRCKEKIEKIYIYETAPMKKVVGEAQVVEILEGTPEEVWNKCKSYSGMEKNDYNNYYQRSEKAIAYKLEAVKKYDTPKELKDYGINFVPQSFVYV